MAAESRRESATENADEISRLFKACDKDGNGELAIEDLARICPDLSHDELQFVFQQLDTDGNGTISQMEFRSGFESVVSAGERHGFPKLKRHASIRNVCDNTMRDQLPSEEETFYTSSNLESPGVKLDQLPCHEDLIQLYSQLQTSGVPELLTQFEKVISVVVKEIKEQKDHNAVLMKVYQKEKDHYSKQISEVETELDQQIAMAEARARREERERLEREKEEMRKQLESEITELQSNIHRLQKVENILAESGQKSAKVGEMKHRLEEMMNENRKLKSCLTNAETRVALVKAEMLTLREEYDERCMEMLSEKEMLLEAIQEQDTLTRQLQMLHDANKKLHDTNDSLRGSLETRQAFCKRFNLRSPSPLSSLSSHSRQESLSSGSEGRPCRPNTLMVPGYMSLKGHGGRYQGDLSEEEDTDSGMASFSAVEDETTPREPRHIRSPLSSPTHGHQAVLVDTDLDSEEDESPRKASRPSNASRLRRKISEQVVSGAQSDSNTRGKPGDRRRHPSRHRRTGSVEDNERQSSIEGPPDRTFRVVMAGDASVGKSSFIMRLCKGKFISTIPSTLGVDFHVKTLNVDGKNVAIQLWDTAGQERFRSLCKSYFRRADGAIMMYDCTSEASMLNVRNWMGTIQENAPKSIPIMICANKIDSRDFAATEGRHVVSAEEGEKLAKQHNALYSEISAKDGTNVKQMVLDLARELLASEDIEMKPNFLILREKPEGKSGCCGR